MDEVETREGGPAESYHTGINSKGAIMAERREINGFDAILFGSPAPFAALKIHARPVVAGKSQVGRQDRYMMPTLGHPARERAHLDDWPSFFLKGVIRLHDF